MKGIDIYSEQRNQCEGTRLQQKVKKKKVVRVDNADLILYLSYHYEDDCVVNSWMIETKRALERKGSASATPYYCWNLNAWPVLAWS